MEAGGELEGMRERERAIPVPCGACDLTVKIHPKCQELTQPIDTLVLWTALMNFSHLYICCTIDGDHINPYVLGNALFLDSVL